MGRKLFNEALFAPAVTSNGIQDQYDWWIGMGWDGTGEKERSRV